uniref:Uncharacterized protein n=1 Tax=Rhodosorus marinus TaxID=101924 RepID=A0A7S0G456_9RHOD|mmetsp:Transcript_2009/g.3028  ORF Transcript_2009/g.3028 Transcript_2009/m.3028 type:complete len:487 (+) Transcript_2009:180-1640(+)
MRAQPSTGLRLSGFRKLSYSAHPETHALLKEVDSLLLALKPVEGIPFPRPHLVTKGNEAFRLASLAAERGSEEAKVRVAECTLWGFGRKSCPREAFRSLKDVCYSGIPEAFALRAQILWMQVEDDYILPSHSTSERKSVGEGNQVKLVEVEVDNHGNLINDPEKKKIQQLRVENMNRAAAGNPLTADVAKEELEKKENERKDNIVACYEAAADLGYVKAEVELGKYFLQSRNDAENAYKWFQKASAKKSPAGYYHLGAMQQNGYGDVKPDFSAALKSFGMAASLGHSQSLLHMGVCSIHGTLGVEKNPKAGLDMVTKAVENDYPAAVHYLALMYHNGIEPVQESDRRFIMLLESAADLGSPDAIYQLGDVYYKGDCGVESNLRRAFELFVEATQFQHAEAQYAAGLMCLYGLGTKQDLTQASELIGNAAGQEYLPAMRSLGELYINGDFGIKMDALGKAWLDRADATEREKNSFDGGVKVIDTIDL